MHDPRNIQAYQWVVGQAWLTPEQAAAVLQTATQHQRRFSETAVAMGALTPQYAQMLEQSLAPRPAPSDTRHGSQYGSQSGSQHGSQAELQSGSGAGLIGQVPQGSGYGSGHGSRRGSQRASGRRGSRGPGSSSAPIPALGEHVDGYELFQELGKGGMGIVFAARKQGQVFALKFITTDDAGARERFQREAQAAEAVGSHNNIVSIHGHGVYDDFPYVVFEYVQGGNLEALLDENQGRGLAYNRILDISDDMVSALDFVHSQGILHRDLKPANILLRVDSGQALISDFGLAKLKDAEKLTQTNELLGTPHYMAPEQVNASHSEIGPWTDVWAYGVMAYEMLTGRRPFAGDSLAEMSAQILVNDPVPPTRIVPNVPLDFETIVLKCLAKDPKDRYPSATELLLDVRAVRHGGPITGTRSRGFSRALRRLKNSGPLTYYSVLAAGFALLLLPLVWLLFLRVDPERLARRQALIARQQSLEAQLTRCYELWPLECGKMLIADSPLSTQPFQLSKSFEKAMADFEQHQGALKATTESSALFHVTQEILESRTLRRAEQQYLLIVGLKKLSVRDTDLKTLKSSLGRAFKSALAAMEALILRDFESARAGFEDLSQGRSKIAVLGRMGLAVLALHQKDLASALARVRPFLKDEQQASVFRGVYRRCHEEQVWQALKTPSFDFDPIKKALAKLEAEYKLDKDGGVAAWRAFNDFTTTRFDIAKPTRKEVEELAQAFENIDRSLQYNAFIERPELSATLHLKLGQRAQAREETPTALYHYLKLQLLDKDFELPKGYGRSDLGIQFAKAFLVGDLNGGSGLAQAFDLFLAASRAHVYLPIMRDDWLYQLHKSGVIRRAIERYPREPYARFWRASIDFDKLNIKSARSEFLRFYPMALSDFEFVLAHKDMPSYFKAIALLERIDLKQAWARRKFKSLDSIREDCLKDFAKISDRVHPEPDQIYRYKFHLVEATASLDELRTISEKRLYWLKQRIDRSESRTLDQGREPGCHLSFIFVDDYKDKAYETCKDLATVFFEREQYDECLKLMDTALDYRPLREPDIGWLMLRCHALWGNGQRDALKKLLRKYKDVKNSGFQGMRRKFLKKLRKSK